eukprot:8556083-Pyramimonas_sp.AAC.1
MVAYQHTLALKKHLFCKVLMAIVHWDVQIPDTVLGRVVSSLTPSMQGWATLPNMEAADNDP